MYLQQTKVFNSINNNNKNCVATVL